MTFFRNPKKVTVYAFISSIVVFFLLFLLLSLQPLKIEAIHVFAKFFIAIALPFLIITPFAGLIYSFFIKDKIKYLYMVLHFGCVCTISVFAFMSFMFRYFVPFAP